MKSFAIVVCLAALVEAFGQNNESALSDMRTTLHGNLSGEPQAAAINLRSATADEAVAQKRVRLRHQNQVRSSNWLYCYCSNNLGHAYFQIRCGST